MASLADLMDSLAVQLRAPQRDTVVIARATSGPRVEPYFSPRNQKGRTFMTSSPPRTEVTVNGALVSFRWEPPSVKGVCHIILPTAEAHNLA